MKKIYLVLLFALCLLFSACGNNNNENNSTFNTKNSLSEESAGENNTQQNNENENSQIKDFTKAETKALKLVSGFGGSPASTLNGFYETAYLGNGGKNILYTDYTSKTRIFLCSRLDCTHNNESCTSWIGDDGGGVVFTVPGQDKLFYCSSGDAYSEDPDRQGKIYKMDSNGANKELLFTLANNEAFSPYGIVSDGDKLYSAIDIIDFENDRQISELRCFDLDSKTVETITELNFPNDMFVGAFDRNILLRTIDGADNYFHTYNIDANEKTEVLQFHSDKYLCFPAYENTVLTFESNGGKKANYIQHDLRNGGQLIMAEEIDFDEASFPSAIYDDKFVYSYDGKAFTFDINTGESKPFELYYHEGNYRRPVNIISDANEYYLVVNGLEKRQITNVGNDGVPYTMDDYVSQYSFILKEDYWASRANFIPVNDIVAGVQ